MRFTKVTLHTSSLSEVNIFYGDVLQLTRLSQSEHEVHFQAGHTRLQFRQAEEGAHPTYHFAFNIPSFSAPGARAWLEAKRISPLFITDYQDTIADFVNWHARAVYFMDPAGNIAEFIAREDRNDANDEQFTPASIRSISEVGLVLNPEQYAVQVERLMQNFNLGYFDKQAPLPQFRAIGDDDGLFIAVPDGRTWYPTNDIAARTAPWELEFENKNHRYHWKYEG